MAGGRAREGLTGHARAAARAGALAAALAAALASTPPARAGWLSDLRKDKPAVRVERTAHGLVHVTAPDIALLGYGVGYAQAQDRGCETANALVTARGERSLWFGPEGGGVLGARIMPNRIVDRFVRGHMDDVALERAWHAVSPEAQALADGVMRGYNRWVAEAMADGQAQVRAAEAAGTVAAMAATPPPPGGPRGPTGCGAAPWLRPMSLVDLHRLVELQAVASGEAAWADAIAGAQPPLSHPLHEPAPMPPLGTGPGAREVAGRPGGVAIAVGGASHGALLYADPAGPWTGPDRAWAVHLVIPGVLDAVGATHGPLPMLATGANATLAWSATRSPARRFTLHQLVLVPGDPTSYVVDGRRERMTSRTVRTLEPDVQGAMQPQDVTLWRSRYGPVVVAPQAGLGWSDTTAWSLQDAQAGHAGALETWLDVARAPDIDALHAALARQGLADTAVVAAGADGRVAWAEAGAVPDVSREQMAACAAPGGAALLWARHGLAVLDGSRAACDWRRDPAATRPGVRAAASLPWIEGRGVLQESGAGWRWARVDPPAGPAATHGAPAGPPATRGAPTAPAATRDAADLLEPAARAAWTPLQGGDAAPLPLAARAWLDRLAAHAGPLEAETLLAWRAEASDEAGVLVMDDLLQACRGAATEATRTGCAALARWDRSDRVDAPGATLFHEWWRQVRGLPDLWRVPFDPADPLHTPRGLRVDAGLLPPGATPRRSELLDALGQAVFTLRQAGFAPDAPLARSQVVDAEGERIALPGGPVDAGARLVVEGRGALALSRAGVQPDWGSDWWQVASFEADGLHLRALLVGGAGSGDDSAGERREALQALAAGRLFDVPLRPDAIAASRMGEPFLLRP